MNDQIVGRILRESGEEGLLDLLAAQLSPTDLQSLLIEVFRRRAAALTPRDLVARYRQDRFVPLARVSPVTQLEFDRLAYSLLPAGFEPVELSPVAPLGACSVVSTVSQNVVVPTIRNTEVCSDSTNVLALECACRRKEILHRSPRAAERVKLCASHRLLRAQKFDEPGSFQHFRALALCTGGRDEGHFIFQREALSEHIDFYIRLLSRAADLGYNMKDVRMSITALDEQQLETLRGGVLDHLAAIHPHIACSFNQERQSGRGYYTEACFHIHARNHLGEDYLLVDGGLTDWTQQLLSNHKERLLVSAIGSERFCACFQQDG